MTKFVYKTIAFLNCLVMDVVCWIDSTFFAHTVQPRILGRLGYLTGSIELWCDECILGDELSYDNDN